MKNIFTISLALFASLTMYAQPGAIDDTFGTSNIFFSDVNIGNGGTEAFCLAVGSDDKIVMAGKITETSNSDIYVTRANADGSLDMSFGSNGYIQIDASLGANDFGFDVAIQNDGKIIITGAYEDNQDYTMVLLRLNVDGSFDESFGNFGLITYQHDFASTRGLAVDVASDGDIVVGASFNSQVNGGWLIMQYNANGVLDSTFSNDGLLVTTIVNNGYSESIKDLAIGNDHSIYVYGSNFNNNDPIGILAKITPAGNLDVSFGDQGKYIYNSPANSSPNYTGIDVTAEGGVWFVGREDNKGFVVKLKPDGTLDNGFNSFGKVTIPEMGYATTIKQYSDRIVIGGAKTQPYKVLTVVYNIDGTPNASFGTQGVASNVAHPDIDFMLVTGLGIQSSGNFIQGGNISLTGDNDKQAFLVRILNPGFTSITENQANLAFNVYPNPTAEAFQIHTENNEKISRVALVNISGQEVQTWTQIEGQYNLSSSLSNGMYMVRIQIGNVISHQLININR